MAQFANDTVINDTGFLNLPTGTTAQRPSPLTGMIRYNTDLGYVELYDGTKWSSALKNVVFFRAPGTTSWTVPQGVSTVEVLVVGGGGGGGADNGGGGGGGGVV